MNKNVDLHTSDCATHNMPALPNGPCDCGMETQQCKCGSPLRLGTTEVEITPCSIVITCKVCGRRWLPTFRKANPSGEGREG